MRLIDADALIENLQGSKVTTDSKDMDYKTMWQLLCTLVVEAIENEPTVLPSAEQTEYKLPGYDEIMDRLDNLKVEFVVKGEERIKRIGGDND